MNYQKFYFFHIVLLRSSNIKQFKNKKTKNKKIIYKGIMRTQNIFKCIYALQILMENQWTTNAE